MHAAGSYRTTLLIPERFVPTIPWSFSVLSNGVVVFTYSQREVPNELFQRQDFVRFRVVIPILSRPRCCSPRKHLDIPDVQRAEGTLAYSTVLFLVTVLQLDPFQGAGCHEISRAKFTGIVGQQLIEHPVKFVVVLFQAQAFHERFFAQYRMLQGVSNAA
ncbi:hypothetical protein D3C77_349370 [compost metagenome]